MTDPVTVVPQSSPRTFLRVIGPEDYEYLRRIEISEMLGPRWRLRGRTVPAEEYAASLWSGVLTQFFVVSKDASNALGIVSCYGASMQDRHAYIAAARLTEEKDPVLVEGIATFMNYVFACWDLRKLYVEVADYNLPQMAGFLGRRFEAEGVLSSHTYLDGRYWDQHVFAITREGWNDVAASIGWLGAPSAPAKVTEGG